MIIDLAVAGVAIQRQTQVAIVGAGIAGLLLAYGLRKRAVQVTVLESGGAAQSAAGADLNKVIQLGHPYNAASHGRSRGLGGTSTRWGGAMVPLLEEDLSERPHVGLPAWPIGYGDLARHLEEIEQLFGLEKTPYGESLAAALDFDRDLPPSDHDFQLRFAKWPRFRDRNVAALLQSMMQKDADLTIILNATVTHFTHDSETGTLKSVVSQSMSGNRAEVSAKKFVLCAGAIEATRLLLVLDRQTNGRLFSGSLRPGAYLTDHISSTAAAEVVPNDPSALNRLAGFRFEGATMRSLRFEMTPAAQRRERSVSAYAHIAVLPKRYGGYDALRDLLRGVQAGRRVRPSLALLALRDVGYLGRLAFWRYWRRQLLWPSSSYYTLNVIAEQVPFVGNYIDLSNETDFFGVPVARINWRVRQHDLAVFATFRNLFEAYWKRTALDSVATFKWAPSGGDDMATFYEDSYHPMGTTRMGDNRQGAVVDRDLRVFGARNLWVNSTSSYPTSGSANPTLTLMLLSLRLADHLIS
jgi:choline dehydrogenase-like flavoprotein